MSAPAPASDRIKAQARFETRALLTNGEQLLVSILLPAIALVGLWAAPVPDLGPGPRIDLATAGALAVAVVSTAFTGQAIATGFDRRAGVLRLFGTTPLGRGGLLAGKALAVLSVLGLQVVVLGGLGLALGWRPDLGSVLVVVMTVVFGAAAFVPLALLLAGTVRAEAVLAIANLVWVLLLGLGLLMPTDLLPTWLMVPARVLPSGALGDALRYAATGAGAPQAAWTVLLVWGLVGALAASRWFRWSD